MSTLEKVRALDQELKRLQLEVSLSAAVLVRDVTLPAKNVSLSKLL